MSTPAELEALKQLFPSLDKSVIAALVTQCGGDKEEAIKRGKQMFDDEKQDEERRIQKKVEELKESFQGVDEAKIKQVLKDNNNDLDGAVEALFEVVQNQLRKSNDDKKAEQKTAHEQELARLFGGIPLAKIQEALEENEGDLDATAEYLIRYTSEIEEKTKAARLQQQQRSIESAQALIQQQDEKLAEERKMIFNSLFQQFSEHYITEPDVQQTLTETNWDTDATAQKLLILSFDRKVDQFSRVYKKSFTRDEIRKVLQEFNLEPVPTMKKLNALKAEKKAQRKVQKELTTSGVSSNNNNNIQQTSNNTTTTTPTTTPTTTSTPVVPEPAAPVKEEEKKPSAEEIKDMLSQSIKIGKTAKELSDEKHKDDVQFIADRLNELRDKTNLGPLGENSSAATKSSSEQQQQQQPTPVPVPDSTTESTNISEEPLRKSLPVGADVKASSLQVDINSNIKLTVSVKRCEVGDDIKVTWSNKTAPSTSDWIAMSKVGARADTHITYQYVGKTDKLEGFLTFKAPNDFLKYEFRYFAEGSYNLKATSEEVSVGPLIELTATHIKATDQQDQQQNGEGRIEVTFQQKAGKIYPGAWIGMYPNPKPNPNSNSEVVVDNSGYRTFKYIKDSVDSKLVFPTFKTGDWEFRYFPTKYTDVARCQVTVTGTDIIVLSIEEGMVKAQCDITSCDPATDGVWIGLYLVGQEDHTQWRRYKAVYGSSAVVTFKLMKTVGEYEARVFANRRYVPVAKSQNTITIKPQEL